MKYNKATLLAILAVAVRTSGAAVDQQNQGPVVGNYRFTFQLDKTSRLPPEVTKDPDLNDDPFAVLEQDNCELDRGESGALALIVPIPSVGDVVTDIHFDGASLTFNVNMWGLPPIKCSGRFDAQSNVQGTGRTTDGSVTAKFKLTRVGPLNTDQQSAPAQGNGAAPSGHARTKVDLSTPERAGKELLQAFLQSDVNLLWACASSAFRRGMTDEVGGTERETIELLRNTFKDNPAPTAGAILRIRMQDEEHCTVQFRWTLKDKKEPQPSLPMPLIKEKGQWRLVKL